MRWLKADWHEVAAKIPKRTAERKAKWYIQSKVGQLTMGAKERANLSQPNQRANLARAPPIPTPNADQT
jgi:hypothetical protein